jgi:transposase
MIDLLFPSAARLVIDDVRVHADSVDIYAQRNTPTAACPSCQATGRRTHSRYQRHPHDLPCFGFRVRLHLTVRRFFCDNAHCPRQTFAESFPSLLHHRARRTQRLSQQQLSVAFAVSAEEGRRLLQMLAMPISGDTLIQDIRRLPEAGGETPRVLGIDDWALRRGQTYGTILVDLESSRPIDLLASREAEAVIAWLREHPGVEIVSRDRSNEYTYAVTTAIPQAIQVADRWHLLKNLREALETLLTHKSAVLQSTAIEANGAEQPYSSDVACDVQAAEVIETPAAKETTLTKASQDQEARRRWRQERFEQVRRLHQAGHSIRAIAGRTNLSRKTVQKYIATDVCPHYPDRQTRPGKMLPWLSYLEQRWQAGCTNATKLWREIDAQGFKGSRSLVSHWAAKQRKLLPAPARYRRRQPDHVTPSLSRLKNHPAWSARRASWLLMKDRDQMDEFERSALARMSAADEQVATATRLAERFMAMVKCREVDKLGQWLADATASRARGLTSFANGIRQDIAAVANALSLPWSNGSVEGHVNRLKFIKRMMYGRANFDLLRKRVLFQYEHRLA